MSDDYDKKASDFEGDKVEGENVAEPVADDKGGDYAGTKSTEAEGTYDDGGDPGKAGENNTSTGANTGNAGGDGSTGTDGGAATSGSTNPDVEGK